MEQAEIMKKRAGEKAAEFVKEGMLLGLGSGSTVYYTLKKLGERVAEGLNIKGIPSSRRTEKWANEFGIPLTTFAEVQQLDLAIDGANEVDQHFNLIKGGGGSLVREKIVNTSSKEVIIVTDPSKMVSELGKFPLPVEVVPFGWEVTAERIEELGGSPKLRMKENEAFISDNGNYILDCKFDSILHPEELHHNLKALLGVVETGLFFNMVDTVIVAEETEVKVIHHK